MFPYWLLFGMFAVGATLGPRDRAHAGAGAGPLLAFCAIIMALMIGLRYEVGADWDQYERLFTVAGRASLERLMLQGDMGYQILNWTVRHLGGEIWQVNLVCALIFCWGLLRLAQSQPQPWLAMVVAVPYLVTVVSMGYTRQAVAIGILMAGLAAVHRGGSMLRFAAYVAVAALFHKTVVMAFPLVMFSAQRNFLLNVLLGIAVSLLFYNLFLEKSVDNLVRNYVDAGYSSQGAAIRIALNFIPAALFMLKQREFGFEERERKVYRNFAVAALLLPVALMLSSSSTAVDRLALYILPLQVVVLSRFPFAYKVPGTGTFLVTIYSAAILFGWLTFAKHAEYWLPYQLYPLG
jgi:hypothetical protein